MHLWTKLGQHNFHVVHDVLRASHGLLEETASCFLTRAMTMKSRFKFGSCVDVLCKLNYILVVTFIKCYVNLNI